MALRDYELVTVFDPDVPDDQVPTAIERISQFVTGRGGEVVEVTPWGRRKLAYPIRRKLEGSYVVAQLRLDPTRVAELDANLRIAEDVLRHLVVRKE